ncbi:hypothetical protein ES332_D03G184600v1 [Gossypium tomentosum]|uniref:Hydroxyproline-rich glycoprotein family protein n=1 Tax=Gossypium tomentosum TaxID=34277 RepID=A0A5D2LS56_GOSTO|nr:hypothetical protein ES332_D03G184600v1 [Gossypium tomentosum]
MRGANGESRVLNNTLETIHAAANAIASAENRVPQATVQKRRWSGWWSVYWCFGSNKQKKRIGPAVLVSETSASGGNVPAAENPNQASSFALPFVAPPSSPASFLPSGPPSATQSPAGLVSLTSISASMYSPGPASIFAIGPYAHETQLVSPPVFSAFPTEPSTAPFTPPPESVHLTTPSSPEVPFAQFLGPNLQYGEQRFPLSHYEFQSYHLQPGSPVGQLISPSSGISGSGTSSPFLDGDYTTGLRFPEFQLVYPSKLLNLDKLSNREWGSYHGSGTLTPDGTTSTPRNGFLLDHQISEIVSHPRVARENQTDQVVVNHRVSFELTNQKAASCVETETATPSEAVAESLWNEAAREREENATKLLDTSVCRVGETYSGKPEKSPADREGKPQHHKNRSITLGSVKEFNFDNINGEREENATKSVETYEGRVGETCNERPEQAPADREGKPQHHKNRSITLGSLKEFNFDNVNAEIEENATKSVETHECRVGETYNERPEKAEVSLQNEAARETEENSKSTETYEYRVGETCNVRPEKAPADKEAKPQHHKNRSITLGSAKEFNFDNLDGGDVHNKPIVSSDWWANEKVAGNDDGIPKNWSFFPMLQPGVS